jgi:hypothetical protein
MHVAPPGLVALGVLAMACGRLYTIRVEELSLAPARGVKDFLISHAAHDPRDELISPRFL